MYDLNDFSITDLTLCGREVRKLGASTTSMEEVAVKVVSFFHDYLRDGVDGPRAVALVRFFKTHDAGELAPELQDFAAARLPEGILAPETKCLTLLATRGEREEWCDRFASTEHRAIPLPSEEVVQQFPMISNLALQIGLELSSLVEPDPSCLRDLDETTYDVFCVPDARGSEFIPAQEDFVVPNGIRSVLGFGGVLPSGSLFAVVIFLRIPVSAEAAECFKSLALSVKMAILPHDQRVIFK